MTKLHKSAVSNLRSSEHGKRRFKKCPVRKHGFLKHPIFKWELRLQLPLGNAFSINLPKILLSVVFLLSSCILCLGQSDYHFCIMKYRDQIPEYTRISIWSKLHIINSYYVITRKYTVLYQYYAGKSTNRVVLILLSLKFPVYLTSFSETFFSTWSTFVTTPWRGILSS